MPTVLFIFGIRFFFYPNDHEPIHIHIKYQGKLAKIQVLPEIYVVENNGLKPQILKKHSKPWPFTEMKSLPHGMKSSISDD